jgi:hypothetical protein
MGDIKIFRYTSNSVSELEGRSAVVEKSLQTLIERNLEAFLGASKRVKSTEFKFGICRRDPSEMTNPTGGGLSRVVY